jgi:hypothetical protein
MTRQRDLKRRIRDRMRETGEPYTLARTAVVTEPEPRGDDVTMTDNTNDRPTPDDGYAPAGTAIPRLCSADLERSSAFYGAIGFVERARYDDYLIMMRDTIELHFARWDFDPETQAVSIFVRVADAAAIHDEVLAAHPDIVRCGSTAITPEEIELVREQTARTGSRARVHAMRETPWAGRQFGLIDPDGNLLQIGEPG